MPPLVVAAGGDGTVRIVADGLAHSGIPMGLIPAGTGMAFHEARKAKEAMDESERRAIAMQEAEELAAVQMANVDAATAAAAAGDNVE